VQTLLLTGPGGAGTSTLAAAAAVHAARSGRRVLLLARPGPLPPGLEAVAGLDVEQVRPLAAVEALWGAVAGELAGALPGVAAPPATSVPPLPGSAELALLPRLAGVAADLVVVDGGPLESATALLGLPATLRWWLDQALPPQVRILGAVRTAAVRAGTARRGPADAALDAVPRVEALLARLRLTDPAATEVRLVAPPRPGALPALRTAVTAMALHGQRPAAVLARVLPAGAPDGWWARRLDEQDGVLADLAGLAPVVRVEEAAVLPADADADAVAALLPAGEVAPVAPLAAPAAERMDGGWRWVLPLPFAERDGLELTRSADDLVVTVADARRSLRLDALLRRCRVTGGSLAAAGTARARLEVTFTPDPQQWPAGLLAAEGSPT
jgi:arsenite/tail-anchored protein-transporting ATPase